MRTQIIENELKAFHISAKDKSPDDVRYEYECVKTKNARSLLYEMSASKGGRSILAHLYQSTIKIKNPKNEQTISIPEAHQGEIEGLCIQGEQSFSASKDKTLKA